MHKRLLAALGAAVFCLYAVPVAHAATPAPGTSASSVDLRAVPGARPHGLGHAVPLKKKRPPWFTADVQRRLAQAPNGVLAAPLDAPLPSEVGIRPGSWMISPAGCTMNFIFSKRATFGIGTAGHCVKVKQKVTLLTLAPGTENPVLVNIGKVLTRRDNGIGDDFALVSIRPELNSWVFPTMALIAGPCGAYTRSGPETVWHVGHGLGIGTGGTPRAGVALTWKRDAFGWDGAAIFGDSGSGVRVTDLKAAGNLTHLVVDSNWLPSFIAGTRIDKMLRIARGWDLVSSSLCSR